MSREQPPCYVIRDYAQTFLTPRMREYKGPVSWHQAPNKLDDLELVELRETLPAKDALAVYGLWWMMVSLAGTLPARDGRLVRRSGDPMTPKQLRAALRLDDPDLVAIEDGIRALVAIGWLMVEKPDPARVLRAAAECSRALHREETRREELSGADVDVGAAHNRFDPSRSTNGVRVRHGPDWDKTWSELRTLGIDDKAQATAFQSELSPAAVAQIVAGMKDRRGRLRNPSAYFTAAVETAEREQGAATSDYLRSHGRDA